MIYVNKSHHCCSLHYAHPQVLFLLSTKLRVSTMFALVVANLKQGKSL